VNGFRRLALPILFALAILAVVAILVVGSGSAGAPTSSTTAADVHPVLGQTAAPVLIREYGDFQCPTCGAFERLVEPQIKSALIDTGKARLEWHDFPWIGPESFAAANAARCADDQGQFWPYHDLLYAHQGGENSGAFSTAHLEAFGATLGLDTTTFDACVAGGTHLGAVRADLADAQSRGFNATPTFLIGTQRVVGAQPFEVFQAAVAAALAAK
jgi:protein-disulfide isomerase